MSESSFWGSVPETAIQRIGWSSGLSLLTMGGSSSAGSRRRAWAIFVCTSWRAASMSFPTSNSTVTLACPCLEEEVICLTPSTVVQTSSTNSTTSVSITSGAAPS